MACPFASHHWCLNNSCVSIKHISTFCVTQFTFSHHHLQPYPDPSLSPLQLTYILSRTFQPPYPFIFHLSYFWPQSHYYTLFILNTNIPTLYCPFFARILVTFPPDFSFPFYTTTSYLACPRYNLYPLHAITSLLSMDDTIREREFGWIESSESDQSAEEYDGDLDMAESYDEDLDLHAPLAHHGPIIRAASPDLTAHREYWSMCAIAFLLDYCRFSVPIYNNSSTLHGVFKTMSR